MVTRRVPLGLRLLAMFFGFGALMCGLTIMLLLFRGTALDVAWRLNPQAQRSFQSLATLSILLMVAVGCSCGAAAIGLFRAAQWGQLIGLVILLINVVADAANAILGHDYRALIGIPIGGAMIVYLWSRTRRKV
jgi:hypothetical protein